MGRSKNSTGWAAVKRKGKSALSEPSDLEDLPNNESKQKGKKAIASKTSAKKKLKFGDKVDKNLPRSEAASNPDNVRNTSEKFMENGDEVLFEVEGQETDFSDDQLEKEQSMDGCEETGDDSDDEVILSQNNNATAVGNPQPCSSKDGQPMKDGLGEEEAGMQRFVEYIREQGLVIVEASQLANKTPKFNKGKERKGVRSPLEMQSVVNRRHQPGEDDSSVATIYHNAVKVMDNQGTPMTNKKRESSSSQERLDTSDEMDRIPIVNMTLQPDKELNVAQFVSDARVQQIADNQRERQRNERGRQHSTLQPVRGIERLDVPDMVNPTEQIIRDAERSKARIYDVQGKANNINASFHSALLDEDYLLVGNYVDETTRSKVAKGEYVDFAKLMPRDKIGI